MAGSRSAARDPPGRVRYSAASGTFTASLAGCRCANPDIDQLNCRSAAPQSGTTLAASWTRIRRACGIDVPFPRRLHWFETIDAANFCPTVFEISQQKSAPWTRIVGARNRDGSGASPLVLDGGIHENAMDIRAHSFGNSLRRLRNDGFGCADHTNSRSKGREVREPIWFDSSTAPTHSAIGPSIHHDSPLPAKPARKCAIEKVAACAAPGASQHLQLTSGATSGAPTSAHRCRRELIRPRDDLVRPPGRPIARGFRPPARWSQGDGR
jgi:hypothetical protein